MRALDATTQDYIPLTGAVPAVRRLINRHRIRRPPPDRRRPAGLRPLHPTSTFIRKHKNSEKKGSIHAHA